MRAPVLGRILRWVGAEAPITAAPVRARVLGRILRWVGAEAPITASRAGKP